jgi:uncharacterized protein YbjT (DUF2867 family)
MTQTVLLAGATGMLGTRIAHHLLNEPDAKLRLLVRNSHKNEKRAALESWRNRGAEILEGDLSDRASLDRATLGVDVIISAVQGGPNVIIDGQVALAEAGKRNGTRRILPSDFGLDLFKATPGEHFAFNARAAADDRIAGLGLEHIHILQGGFMDLFGPGSPLMDYNKGLVTFWGDGTQPIEITSIDDTARMTARVALDRTVASGKFSFCGDKISFQQAADVAEAQTGKKFARHSLGSETELRAAMAEKAKSDPFQAVMLAYQLYMLNGQTSLDNLQSERYADIKLDQFSKFLAERLSEVAGTASAD